jgi:hypothetical protein
MTLVTVVAPPPPPIDATSFENGYSQQMSWCVLQLVNKESVTAVQRALRTQFHMEPSRRVSTYAWYKKFEQEGCICKGESLQARIR